MKEQQTARSAEDWLAARDKKRAARTAGAKAYGQRPKPAVVHKVYEYLFDDGKRYVGVTKLTLAARQRAHKEAMSVVGRRLDMFPEEMVEYRVLEEFPCDADDWKTCRCRADAEAAEQEAILSIPPDQRLNIVTTWGNRPMTVDEDWRRRVAEGREPEPPGGWVKDKRSKQSEQKGERATV